MKDRLDEAVKSLEFIAKFNGKKLEFNYADFKPADYKPEKA